MEAAVRRTLIAGMLLAVLLFGTAGAATCLVKGYVKNFFGDGIKNAQVRFEPVLSGVARSGTSFLVPTAKSVATDSTGYFEISVVRTGDIVSAGDSAFYNVWVTYPMIKGRVIEVRVSPDNGIGIPDSTSIWLPTWRLP